MLTLADNPADLVLRNELHPADRRLSTSEELELPMTLLAAVRDGADILVAADGKGTYTDVHSGSVGTRATQKLFQLGEYPVVWGYRGVEQVGEPLRLQIDEAEPSTWNELLPLMGRSLRVGNSDSQSRGQSEPTEILLAGELNGESKLIHMDPWGNPIEQRDFCFVGAGWLAGRTAWVTVQTLDPPATVEERLVATMESAMQEIAPLGAPLWLWRITSREAMQIVRS